jgi:hypothetical protein
VRNELADPVSDRVIEAFVAAHEHGRDVIISVLRSLADNVTKDLQVVEQITTSQTEIRSQAVVAVILPFGVLAFLVAANDSYRSFYRTTGGWIVVTIGVLMAIGGWKLITVLGRIPAEERVLVGRGNVADGRPRRHHRCSSRSPLVLRPRRRPPARRWPRGCSRTPPASPPCPRDVRADLGPILGAGRSACARVRTVRPAARQRTREVVDASSSTSAELRLRQAGLDMTVEQYRTRQLAYTAARSPAGAFLGLLLGRSAGVVSCSPLRPDCGERPGGGTRRAVDHPSAASACGPSSTPSANSWRSTYAPATRPPARSTGSSAGRRARSSANSRTPPRRSAREHTPACSSSSLDHAGAERGAALPAARVDVDRRR